jgi:hypothetical protein
VTGHDLEPIWDIARVTWQHWALDFLVRHSNTPKLRRKDFSGQDRSKQAIIHAMKWPQKLNHPFIELGSGLMLDKGKEQAGKFAYLAFTGGGYGDDGN